MVKKILFITSNLGIEHAALIEPLEHLKAADFQVIHATEHKSDIETVEDNIKPAFRYPSEYSYDDINPHDFVALVLPGGIANADSIRVHPQVIQLVQHFADTGKLIATTGHAAWVLINAERIQGKTLSTSANIHLDLKHAGGTLQESTVSQCDQQGWRLISTCHIDDFEDFTQQIIQALNQ